MTFHLKHQNFELWIELLKWVMTHATVDRYGFQLTYLTSQVIVSEKDKDFACPVYLISTFTQTKQSSHFGIFFLGR